MNSVFSLLIGNPGIKLSVKSMSKRLGIKKKEVFYLCFKDPPHSQSFWYRSWN